MKIILLHGDDELKSYKRLSTFMDEAKSRSWDIVSLDDSDMTFQEALVSSALFPKERFFVLKDIKKLGKKETEWLGKKSKDLGGNLIIYHQGFAPITLIKSLPQPLKVEEFKLPKLIFQFLESISPKNIKGTIELLHEIAETQPPEFIFSLLSKQIRDLYWVKIDEKTLPYPSWRVGKLKKQADNFSTPKLKELLALLAKIDVNVKTSNAEIVPSLDLFIATRLEL